MKNVFYLTVLLATFLSKAQTNTIDYIAYAEGAYYEIVKLEDDVSVLKYYLDASKIKQATLIFSSLKEIKSQLNVKILVKAKRLAKNWDHNKQVSFNFKTDTIYAFNLEKTEVKSCGTYKEKKEMCVLVFGVNLKSSLFLSLLKTNSLMWFW